VGEPDRPCEGAALYLGDCLAVLPGLPDGSVDAVVTDPPAGIKFMGVGWDSFATPKGDKGHDRSITFDKVAGNHNPINGIDRQRTARAERTRFIAFLTPIMAGCMRVLKPGGYALVWALPRTSHWTATALEDAGFEIRDVITHLFGQGFPKGKGCLKPAAEHWILCRRPGPRVLPLNIDECRLGTDAGWDYPNARGGKGCFDQPGLSRNLDVPMKATAGRWPANLCLSHHPECVCRGTKRVRGITGGTGNHQGNVYGKRTREGEPVKDYAGPDGTEEVEDCACHPECPVFLLDSQAGERNSGGPQSGKVYEDQPAGGVNCYGDGWARKTVKGYRDSGNASRFFYVSKADRADRGEGNDHPTTKPTALMSWLCKLVTRPGETVLDPFAGSGSTGVAALRCERRFVGVEKDAHYFQIALKRLAAVDGPLFAAPAAPGGP
jgi:DNA modification methylase